MFCLIYPSKDKHTGESLQADVTILTLILYLPPTTLFLNRWVVGSLT